MLTNRVSICLRICARRLHVDYICAGIPAPYHRNRKLVTGKDRVLKVGDDATIASSDKKGNIALGVADGVGGWRQHGYDAGYVSLGLLTECLHLVKSGSWVPDDPVQWIDDAHNRLLKNCDKNILGSSTVCLCGVNTASATLHAANVGDSGLTVVTADGNIRLKTTSLQVDFNAPLQLGAPAELAQHYANAGHAEYFTTKLEDGDLVLLSTDGLLDNFDEDQLSQFLTEQRDLTQDMEDLATTLVKRVLKLSESETYKSPFAKKASASGYEYIGGKPDDISIVLMSFKL